MINIANNLDPDQTRYFVGPDLDPSCLILKEFLKNLNFEEKNQMTREQAQLPSMHGDYSNNGKCSKILNTICLSKKPRQTAQT